MTGSPTLAGRHLLVTGGGSGIGLEFVRCAVNDGARVVVVSGDNSALRDLLPKGQRITADLTEADAARGAVEHATQSLGGVLDGVVSSAGVFLHKTTLETSDDDWDRVLDINLRASFRIARAAAPTLMRSTNAAMVFVSSQIGLIGHPQAAAYAASKAGIHGLVKSLALELAPAVRVNAVAPGPIETPMTADALADAERAAALRASVPLGRIGKPEEVALAVRMLLSHSASFVTGHIMAVDGGITGQ